MITRTFQKKCCTEVVHLLTLKENDDLSLLESLNEFELPALLKDDNGENPTEGCN